MTVPTERIGKLLALQRRAVDVDPAATYQEIGVRSFGRGLFVKPMITGADLGGKRVFTIKDRDLVVSNVFAWEGAVAVAAADHDEMIGSHRFMTWSPRDADVDVGYLCHYFGSDAGLQSLRRASPGSAGRNRTLSIDNFKAIEVPLPKIEEQRRIAAHLDDVSAGAARVITSQGTIERTRQALVDMAFDQHEGAPTRTLGSLLQRDRERFEPVASVTYLTIGIRGFGRGLIRYAAADRVDLPKMRFFRLHPDRLVVSNIKAWEGAVALTTAGDAERIASNRFMQYRVTSGDTSLPYLHAYLMSRGGLAQLQAASPGSADRNRTLSMDGFERIRVPLASTSAQTRLLELLARLTRCSELAQHRGDISAALLPAARNEIFSAML